VVIAGTLVSWIVGALEGAVVVGGASALGAGLASMGIPRDSIAKYETAIKADKFLLLAHGTPEQVGRAKSILGREVAWTLATDVAEPRPVPACRRQLGVEARWRRSGLRPLPSQLCLGGGDHMLGVEAEVLGNDLHWCRQAERVHAEDGPV
jgi:hypothetical protein